MQDVHPNVHAQFMDEKATTKRCSKRPNEDCDLAVPSKKHQCTIDPSMNRLNEQKVIKQISQSEFDTSLLVMLLEDMQPVTTVERSGFKKFIMNILPHIHLPSRRTLGRQIDILYEQHKAMLVDEFKQVRYISLTADLWSSHKRGFLGMTAHYIDQQSLQFVSNTLTFRRFKHSHTGQEIAAMIRYDMIRYINLLTRTSQGRGPESEARGDQHGRMRLRKS
jgi:hypothetical protein